MSSNKSAPRDLDNMTTAEMITAVRDFYHEIGFKVFENFDYDNVKRIYKAWLLTHHPDKVRGISLKHEFEEKVKGYNQLMDHFKEYPEHMYPDELEAASLLETSETFFFDEASSDSGEDVIFQPNRDRKTRADLPEFNGPLDPKHCRCGKHCAPFQCELTVDVVLNWRACYCERDGKWLDVCPVGKCLLNGLASMLQTDSSDDGEFTDIPPGQPSPKKKRRRAATPEPQPSTSQQQSQLPPKKRQHTTPPKRSNSQYGEDHVQSSQSTTPKKADLSDFDVPSDYVPFIRKGSSSRWKAGKDFLFIVPKLRLKDMVEVVKAEYQVSSIYTFVDKTLNNESDQEHIYAVGLLRFFVALTPARLEVDLKKKVSTVKPFVCHFKAGRFQQFYEFVQLSVGERFDECCAEVGSIIVVNQMRPDAKMNHQLLADWIIEREATSESWVYCNYRKFAREPVGEQMCQCGCDSLVSIHKLHHDNAMAFANSPKVKEVIKNGINQYRWIKQQVQENTTLAKTWSENFSNIGGDYTNKVLFPGNDFDRTYLFGRLKAIWGKFDSIFVKNDVIDVDRCYEDEYIDGFSKYVSAGMAQMAQIRAVKVVLLLQLVWEYIVHANSRKKCIMFYGEIETGKSTLAKCITAIFGGMQGSLPLDSQNAFQLAHVAQNATMVMFDDLRIGHFKFLDDFRSIFDKTIVQLPVKYGNPVACVFPPMIVTSNVHPRGLSDALSSRIKPVYFNKKIGSSGVIDEEDITLAFVLYCQMVITPLMGTPNPADWSDIQDIDPELMMLYDQYRKPYQYHKSDPE